jgi:hypothetical protein
MYDLRSHVYLVCSIVLLTCMVLGHGSLIGMLFIVAHMWASVNAMVPEKFEVQDASFVNQLIF